MRLSTRASNGGLRWALALSLLALLLWAPSAFAGTVLDRPPSGEFDGSDSSAGAFENLSSVAVDYASGDVYALDTTRKVVCKFDAEGKAQAFSTTGKSCLHGIETDLKAEFAFSNGHSAVAVDNSPGPDQGDLYVLDAKGDANGPLYAFTSGGAWVPPTLPPSIFGGGFSEDCGITVGADGGPWVFNRHKYYVQHFAPPSGGMKLLELVRIHEINGSVVFFGNCGIAADSSEDLYLSGEFTFLLGGGYGIAKYDRASGEWLAFYRSPSRIHAVAVDQSPAGGHVFALHEKDFTELEPSGAEIGSFGVGTIGTASFGAAIAYNPAKDWVYVGDGKGADAVHIFGPLADYPVPDATLEPPSAIGATTAHFAGAVNSAGVETGYRFQWKKSSQSWEEAASSPAQTVPNDSSDHPVSFDASGLSDATIYNVRIRATNTDIGASAYSNVENFSHIAPLAVTRGAAPRTDTTARISALLSPAGNATAYRFEYKEEGGEAWTALPERREDPGETGVHVLSEELTGLLPATAYRFRFSAENDLGAVAEERSFTTRTSAEMSGPASCPNEDVRAAQHSSYLPDCRGLELVNQPDKNSQNASPPGGYNGPLASADGGTALWSVVGGAPGAYTKVAATFVAERSAGGWASQALVPPPERQFSGGAGFYSLMGATPAFSRFVLGTQDTEEHRALVGIDRSQDEQVLRIYEDVSGGLPVDLSDDGAHVVALNRDTGQLEEIGGGEPAEVLSLMPGGGESECGLKTNGASFRSPFDFPGPFGGASTNADPGYHMIATTDASRVYFQAAPDGNCGGLYGLYVRNREAGGGVGETTLIDPGTTVGGSPKEPNFIRATPDGRAAYFTTSSTCRKWSQGASPSCEAKEEADKNTSPDVYRWNEEAGTEGESECLTCGLGGNANLFGPVRVSDDFSHIYFVSKAALAPGAEAGAFNLYALSGGQARFVADLLGGSDLVGQVLARQARLSADGEVLLFAAKAGPSLSADQVALGLTELYRYDDRDQSLECVSCRHGGLTEHAGVGNGNPFAMSADGTTIAFRTEEALLPSDVNRGPDVYEWRNGAVHLITDGVREFPLDPEVWSVDAEGSNIFFAAVAPGLTGFEHDGLANLYDAREGGGWQPPTPPAHCSEDSCQGPLQAAPTLDQPASQNESRGNPPPARKPCRKGKVRRHGECVNKHRGHRGHHKHRRRRARANRGGTK